MCVWRGTLVCTPPRPRRDRSRVALCRSGAACLGAHAPSSRCLHRRPQAGLGRREAGHRPPLASQTEEAQGVIQVQCTVLQLMQWIRNAVMSDRQGYDIPFGPRPIPPGTSSPASSSSSTMAAFGFSASAAAPSRPAATAPPPPLSASASSSDSFNASSATRRPCITKCRERTGTGSDVVDAIHGHLLYCEQQAFVPKLLDLQVPTNGVRWH